jgi:glycerol-3-phosphate dehydrogenase
VNFHTDETGKPLQDKFSNCYEYSDCWVEDPRPVMLLAKDAAALRAEIRTRITVRKATRIAGEWQIETSSADGTVQQISAKALINAAGPWVN